VQHIDVTALAKVMENYDTTGAALDEKVLGLEKTLKSIDDQLVVERKNLTGPSVNNKLGQRATIGVFADVEGEVEMVLIYGVLNNDRLDRVSDFVVKLYNRPIGPLAMIFGLTCRPKINL
jgi:hypothetical protein